MEKGKRPTIAVLMGNTQSEYVYDLIQGFSACAKEENVNLIFLLREGMPYFCRKSLVDKMGENYNQQFLSIYEYVPYVKPDAMIIAYGSMSVFPDTPDKSELIAAFKGVPCLMFEAPSDDPDVPYLIADNYNGMRECIEHLVVDHGYRRVAFLSGPKTNHDADERLRAYRDVMRENGLPVTDTMVTYGDYTEDVEEQVEYLMDKNPGLEAIAFANDTMAKTGYRICSQRGLVVGKDMAITGFDDIELAANMIPPLTSVAHSSFLYSYQALQDALMLCRGEKTAFEKMPAVFRKRRSCGCATKVARTKTTSMGLIELEKLIERRTVDINEKLFAQFPYEKVKKQYLKALQGYFLYIYEEIFAKEGKSFAFGELTVYLKKLCSCPHVSTKAMVEELVVFLRELMEYTWAEDMRALLAECIEISQRHVHSSDVLRLEEESDTANNRSWFLATFTRDLINMNLTSKENLNVLMDRMQQMQIKSTYFFFYENAVIRGEKLSLKRTEQMYLAAYYNEHDRFCAEPDERKLVEPDCGINTFLPQDGSHFYTTYSLFSGNEHYGVMVCEVEQKDIYFALACSLQIGSLFHVLRIEQAERDARSSLESSMELIREQNSILSFISEYDELTRLLNRRGFMEKTLHEIKDNEDRQALLLFADVDHLKEINDSFGHAAGDLAIRTGAAYLRECLPDGSVIARIGGDEFTAFVFPDEEHSSEQIAASIRQHAKQFNETHDEPFYVEMSVGIFPFVCSPETNLQDIIGKSDSILYEEKKHRRKSIKKEAPK